MIDELKKAIASLRDLAPSDCPTCARLLEILRGVSGIVVEQADLLHEVRKEVMCKCGQSPKGEPAPCPFASEIRDNHTPCDCCRECRHQCAMDI